MAAKFGPLKKDKKRLASIELKFFRRTSGYTVLYHKRNEENFGKSRTSCRETKTIQIKLTTTYNKNEQQDAKNNPEL